MDRTGNAFHVSTDSQDSEAIDDEIVERFGEKIHDSSVGDFPQFCPPLSQHRGLFVRIVMPVSLLNRSRPPTRDVSFVARDRDGVNRVSPALALLTLTVYRSSSNGTTEHFAF